MTDQLSLNMKLKDDATFESFFVGNNEEAYSAVQKIARGEGDPFLYLFGGIGSGRSHLLQAACQFAQNLGFTAIYIPFQHWIATNPSSLLGLEGMTLICIDDLDVVAGYSAWEEALFHLFNRTREQGTRLLVAANEPPSGLAIALPDLKSRLTWGTAYPLRSLEDDQKLLALTLRAKVRGLELTTSVGRFLLNHCPRDMGQLFSVLENLDNASWLEQRKLTIPFVKSVLNI